MTGFKKILIVEDDRDIAHIYSSTLQKNDYEVQIAIDGEAALEAVLKFQPDVILLDIMIPVLDGLGVLKILRHDPKYKHLQPKVLVMTNLAEQSVRDKAKNYGAQAYVVKANIVPSDLVSILKELATRSGSKTIDIDEHK